MQTEHVPTLSTVYPEWRVLSDKLRALSEREDEITIEMHKIRAEQGNRSRIHFQSPATDIIPPPKVPPALSASARALLGDVAPAPEAPAPAERRWVHNRWGDADLHRLGIELGAIYEAKAVIHPLLSRAHAEGSSKLCSARMDEYRAVAARLCAALVEVGNAMSAHDALIQSVTEGGAEWHHFRPVDMHTLKAALGDPAERYSRLRILLAGAAEGGHFDLSAIPTEWTTVPSGPNVASVGQGRRRSASEAPAAAALDATPPAPPATPAPPRAPAPPGVRAALATAARTFARSSGR